MSLIQHSQAPSPLKVLRKVKPQSKLCFVGNRLVQAQKEVKQLRLQNQQLRNENYRLKQLLSNSKSVNKFLTGRIGSIEEAVRTISRSYSVKSVNSKNKIQTRNVFELPNRFSKAIEAINFTEQSQVDFRRSLNRKKIQHKPASTEVNFSEYIGLFKGMFQKGSVQQIFNQRYSQISKIRSEEGLNWVIGLPPCLIALFGFMYRLCSLVSAAIGTQSQGRIRTIQAFLLKEFNCERIVMHSIDYDHRQLRARIGQVVCRQPFGRGQAFICAQRIEVVNLQDAYKFQHFSRQLDILTNFFTKSLLCVPVLNDAGTPIAVIQLINKKERPYHFTEFDQILVPIAGQALRQIIQESLKQQGQVQNKYFRLGLQTSVQLCKAASRPELLRLAQDVINRKFGLSQSLILMFQDQWVSRLDKKSSNELMRVKICGVVEQCRKAGREIAIKSSQHSSDYNLLIDLGTIGPFNAVPIILKDQVVGVIELVSYSSTEGVKGHSFLASEMTTALVGAGCVIYSLFKLLPQ